MTQARHPYQDAGLPVDSRVDDLLGRLELEEKAALMFQPMTTVGPLDQPGRFGMPATDVLLAKGITHFNILFAPTARALAEWHNDLQERALRTRLGIPISFSSDPRHHFSNNPMTAMIAGPFAQFPEPLGLAAIGSEDLVGRFADIARRELVAVGIRTALHPQIDLTTEPRWARQSGTFGEDAALTSRLAAAYIRGLQGSEFGPSSVSAMAKHFPGAGPQKDGEDAHFEYGREQVYPGGRFGYHLEPFKAAIAAGVRQMMPYYGMPIGTEWEEVGFNYNKRILTDLLRGELGFDGIVCSDWAVLTQRPWGVEDLSIELRMKKGLDAGIDQWGGDSSPEILVGLVRAGAVPESRLDLSVRRLLREKFLLGLFENPFVDADAAEALVGSPASRTEGLAAQAAAHTLLKNAAGPAHLPLARGLRIYAEGLTQEHLADRATLVATPAGADVAILRLQAPYEERGEPRSFERLFHAGSLAFPELEIARVRAIAGAVPTVIDLYLDRPAIVAPFVAATSALIVNFGAQPEVLVDVLFGEAEPRGRLPFDLPSSMEAVVAGHSDVPFDTANPTFRFGSGLAYER